MYVGALGNGSLVIKQGAVLHSLSAGIGRLEDSLGSVTVDGAGSAWETNSLELGYGQGSLNIINGGRVTAFATEYQRAMVAIRSGDATVSGSGSHFDIEGTLSLSGYIYGSNSSLKILAGATLTSMSASIGHAHGSSNSILLSGMGSTWLVNDPTYGGAIDIAEFGQGDVTVEAGAKMESGSVNLTYLNTPDTRGRLTVRGHGSEMNIGSYLTSGLGEVEINVESGARLQTPSLFLAYDYSEVVTHPYELSGISETVVNLRGSEGARGVLETEFIETGDGTVMVRFDGGVLRAAADQENMLQASQVEILGGGAFIDTQDHAISVFTSLEGEGHLTKQGSGRLILQGSHTHAGGTTVVEGALWLDNASHAGAITVEEGAKLGGNGSMGGLSVRAGSILAPGNSPGELIVSGGMTLDGGAIYEWEINAATGTSGVNWDLITVEGTLYLSASFDDPIHLVLSTLAEGNSPGELAGFDLGTNYLWEILRAWDGIEGFSSELFIIDANGFANDPDAGRFEVTQTGQSLYLTYTTNPVPEPSGAMLAVLALAGLFLRRRRLRSSSWS